MCNLFSDVATQAAIKRLAKVTKDRAGNVPPQPSIFPDGKAPVVREGKDGRELIKMRWGMPNPPIFGGFSTNIRNTESKWWLRWLGPEHRCLVPATSFCEYTDKIDPATKKKTPTWFALNKNRDLFFFAGVWCEWEGTRGTKKEPEEGRHLLFAFLTTDPNSVVKPVHSKAMPVMLTTEKERETWLGAPTKEALKLQRPFPATKLKIVASGERKDAA